MQLTEIRSVGRAAASALFILGLSALVACGGPKKEESTEAPAPEAPAPAEQAAPAPAPAPAPEAAAPAPAETTAVTLGDASKGKVIYDTYCVTCHGPKGHGDGPAASTLPKKPADHSDGNYMNPMANAELYKAIKEGGASVGKSNAMPPWGATLNDEQVRDVLAYVRSLANPPYTGPK